MSRSRGDRVRTLVLEANGAAWREAAVDTVVLGLLRARDYEFVPERLRYVRFVRLLRRRYDHLGYMADWREAVEASAALDVSVCNVTNLVEYASYLHRIREFDLVIALHSAAGDSTTFLERGLRRLLRRRGPLVVFIGNEYDLMEEKTRFLRESGAEFVCSQLPLESARWLYAESGAQVLEMPHALNPRVYEPGPQERRVDIGFAGAMYPPFIGDDERTRLIRAVEGAARDRGLRTELHEETMARTEWARFLQSCAGTVGAESGTYWLDRRGTLIARAKAYVAAHPAATADEVREHVFAPAEAATISGKCISSRHFEAIGTKTCQVLLEGDYNGILEPDAHYVTVRKDLSDVDAALDRFADAALRREIAERAYDHVRAHHTHAHRVAALVAAVGG